MNDIFEQKILTILNATAPLKTVQRRRQHRNWVTLQMKEEMQARDNLRQKAKDTGSQVDWQIYRKARNQCVKSLEKCKSEYYG